MENEEMVQEGLGCPRCGERRMDWLNWVEDEHVQCGACDYTYEVTE
jgi:ribosomal protein S27AE